MVYRQDQILALPFPPAPSLARQIDGGVLKKEGAIRHDEAVQRDREAIQNILKAYLRWPQLEEWQQVITNITNLTTNVTNNTTVITQSSADITELTATSDEHTTEISALENSINNLTAAINSFWGQYVFTQVAPASVWTINHGRPVRPGVANVMEATAYVQLHGVQQIDDTIGQTRLYFDYNEAGIAILTFT